MNDTTNLIFIALHRDYQNITSMEYFIDINKIVAITPHNHGGTIINTVSAETFYCKESINEVIKLMNDAFQNRLKDVKSFQILK